MSNSLVRKEPTGLQLNTVSEWLQYADVVCRTDIVPKDYKGKPADCFVAMQYGHELGLQPLQSLQSIAVINGRPTVWGDALPAIAFATGECEDFSEDDTETIMQTNKAVCTIKRRGMATPFTAVYSKDQAVKAGLWAKQGPWQQHPFRMLQMRARAWAIRAAFPDKLKGVQAREEVEDYQEISPAAVLQMPRRLSERQPEQAKPQSPPTPEPPPPPPPPPQNAGSSVGAPVCESCGTKMEHRPAGKKDGREWEPYYRCPQYTKGSQHSVIKEAEWLAQNQPKEPGSDG